MSKIENICKAVASLPHVKADANVFMLDDFSGQIQTAAVFFKLFSNYIIFFDKFVKVLFGYVMKIGNHSESCNIAADCFVIFDKLVGFFFKLL